MKNNKLKPVKIFGLIKDIISKFNLTGMLKYLCKIANVFTSGYYKILGTKELRNHKEIDDLKAKELIQKIYLIIVDIRKALEP